MRAVSPKLVPWLANFNQQMEQLLASGFKATATNAREGLANLTKGLVTDIPAIAQVQDEVVAGGGIIGKVTNVGDNFIEMSVSDNTTIKVQRQAVAAVMPKGTMKNL